MIESQIQEIHTEAFNSALIQEHEGAPVPFGSKTSVSHTELRSLVIRGRVSERDFENVLNMT